MEDNKENTPEMSSGNQIRPENNSSGFDSSDNNLSSNLLFRKIFLFTVTIVASVLSVLIFSYSILYFAPEMQDLLSGKDFSKAVKQDSLSDASLEKQLLSVEKEIQKLSKKYNAYTPGLSYIVINTTGNRFSLYKNKTLIREGFCSTGKLTLLKTESGDKEWVFKTPRGERWIRGKITHPTWTRPDWSFIEEGLPLPPKNDPTRYESGVLGDYALSIGDGYLIHGTIYKRFLGMPVTHGCVRLNDEDLEVVYNTLNIGSKVYIF